MPSPSSKSVAHRPLVVNGKLFKLYGKSTASPYAGVYVFANDIEEAIALAKESGAISKVSSAFTERDLCLDEGRAPRQDVLVVKRPR